MNELQLLPIRIRDKFRLPAFLYKRLHASDPQFECPICSYVGPFRTQQSWVDPREYAVCPRCGSLERHRLQFLVIKKVVPHRAKGLRILHFAPERCLAGLFDRAQAYDTADLSAPGVTFKTDLRAMKCFKEESYDVFLASHVLEHVEQDWLALKEIRRVLKPGGIAMLPVPIVNDKTVEYSEANEAEGGHWRAPGPDYFDKYRKFFGDVKIFTSADFPEKYQTHVYEKRSHWPTKEMPHRTPSLEYKHLDFVPVCS